MPWIRIDIVASVFSSYLYVEVYADGYDDEYRGNTEDRAWLDTLTEREREAELLKRHEQREILNHRYEKTNSWSIIFGVVLFSAKKSLRN